MTWDNNLITEDLLIVSDTHWGHGNIVKYGNRPRNHNDLMFDNWFDVVEPGRPVLHLGDVAMDKRDPEIFAIEARIRLLTGEKFMIRGNHDGRTSNWIAQHWDMTEVKHRDILGPKRQKRITVTLAGTRIAFSHRPLDANADEAPWDINIHGHIHINGWSASLVESGRDYRNVCVEQMEYKPWTVRDILNGQCQRISSAFINPRDENNTL